mmetsp:Transcript_67046/g.111463  ORF Transcript_67046/g.111463 Transcript_67046/m.111463 type:complete len:348 (-) Transcript_67046:103-1146(-)|eukprot:CAMPEP_0119300146 /NCGR_PEP_ID=MMETSP1333-20130426/2139_1 /TAXON_ID=418940 /ORGANISM="Scyphosphaera apsteinii, Strain RCC1455" /LENGTH=347 /DNA_ID=CAMNT_0007301817 /DNA_START=102 /DNA_END=1145 /DNA_ORIENTATION=+
MHRGDEDDGSEDDEGPDDDEPLLDEVQRGGPTKNFRMYENEFPEIDELVMVQVKSIAEMGAYVSLMEYNNIEGMILLSELSRRRIRSINKLIRVGKQEVCMVLRVDTEKGYIDLSKRRVSPEDVVKCDERFQRSKAVHSIVRHVAETQHVEMEHLYSLSAWPLYRKYGHAYEAFRLSINDPDSIFDMDTTSELKAQPELLAALLVDIAKRLTPTAIKVRADIEVTCFQYEGINAIKRALLKGMALGSDDLQIKIKLVAPPLYVMLCSALDKNEGIKLLNDAIDVMQKDIRSSKGDLQVKSAPRAVDERDDKLLSNLMSTLEQQNQEIGGDDDEDEQDEGMGNVDIGE